MISFALAAIATPNFAPNTTRSDVHDVMAELLALHEPSDLSSHWESPSDMRENMRRLQAAVRDCEWDPAPRKATHVAAETSADYTEYFLNKVVPEMLKLQGHPKEAVLRGLSNFNPTPNRQVPSHICHRAAERPGESWRVHRIGPVESRGGYDWHTFASADALGLASLLEDAPGGAWITALAVFPVDERGHALGYPPIHIHHSHLGMYRNPGTEFIGALSFPHGDSICSAEDGGEACFMVSFPTGFGAPIRDQLLLNALVNDVRERSAPPMRFSLQLAVRITRAPQRDVGLWYAAAIPDFVDGGFLRTVRSGKQLFVQFKIPADRESVLWTTLVVRESGRWLNLWMHTHPLLGFEEQWLISATPRELGLNAGAFQPPRCHGPFVPSAHGLTSDDVRSRIVAHMRASGLKFRCIVTQTAEHVANVAGIEGVLPRAYDRQGRRRCYVGAERLTRGAAITAVTFFSDRACLDPIACRPGALVENHMHFQGYTIFDEPPEDLLQYQAAHPYGSYKIGGRYDATCGLLDALGGPELCPWEIPGCALPGMPEAPPKLVKLVHVLSEIVLPGSSAVVGAALMLVAAGCCLGFCARRFIRVGRRAQAAKQDFVRISFSNGEAAADALVSKVKEHETLLART